MGIHVAPGFVNIFEFDPTLDFRVTQLSGPLGLTITYQPGARPLLLAWTYNEHLEVATDATMNFGDDSRLMSQSWKIPDQLLLVNVVWLSYHEIVALAGDWWGRFDDNDNPIYPREYELDKVPALLTDPLCDANPEQLARVRSIATDPN